ncbi:MAG: hypothetical protein AAB403_01160, partial [Planctomycetota bacterium]
MKHEEGNSTSRNVTTKQERISDELYSAYSASAGMLLSQTASAECCGRSGSSDRVFLHHRKVRGRTG